LGCILGDFFTNSSGHPVRDTYLRGVLLVFELDRELCADAFIPDPIPGCQMVCFQTKIPIWVNFGGSGDGRCWYILRTLGPFYGLLLYFMGIWYSLWLFGIVFPILVFRTKKNLATLIPLILACTFGRAQEQCAVQARSRIIASLELEARQQWQ
jgi:hypothetical protein